MATRFYFQSGDSWSDVVYRHGGPDRLLDVDGADLTSPFGIATMVRESRGSGLASLTHGTFNGPANAPVGSTNGTVFFSAMADADVTVSGSIVFNLWASESSMSANAAINCLIWLVDAQTGLATEVHRTNRTTELGTSMAVANFSESPTSFTVHKGDTLLFMVFVKDSSGPSMNAGFTVTFDYNGTTADADGDSYVEFTESIGVLTSAPAGTTVFLTNSAASGGLDVGVSEKEAWTSRGGGVTSKATTIAALDQFVQATDGTGGSAIEWYTRPLQAFTLSGLILANLRGLESATTVNAGWTCEIAVVDGDGTNPVVYGIGAWARDSIPSAELGTTEDVGSVYIAGNDISVSDGQRIRIRMYWSNNYLASAMASGTCTLFYASTTGSASGDAFVTFGQTLTEFSAVPRWEQALGPIVVPQAVKTAANRFRSELEKVA